MYLKPISPLRVFINAHGSNFDQFEEIRQVQLIIRLGGTNSPDVCNGIMHCMN